MIGPRQAAQGALFYEFSIEEHVPSDHILRAIDRFVDLTGIRQDLAPYYSSTGRPSVDPELMIAILLVGNAMGIRSERQTCDEVHLNLAYRRFCRLDLTDPVPDHSTFSKNRHGRFRHSDLLRKLFETAVAIVLLYVIATEVTKHAFHSRMNNSGGGWMKEQWQVSRSPGTTEGL